MCTEYVYSTHRIYIYIYIYIYTHTHTRMYRIREHYLAIKKTEIMPFATTWMNLEKIIPSKPDRKSEIYTYTF